MEGQTFVIKTLMVQNTVMLISLGIVVFFLLRSFMKGRLKHVVVFLVWVGIVFWFFNSPFFGFSRLTVSPKGIQVQYGILSFRNTTLALDTKWEIETRFSGIIRTTKLYDIRMGEHRSMRVKGKGGLELLQKIGRSIDGTKKAWKAGE
ncbi:MAG: hypothetical protein WAL98_18755 [Desulfatiglandaceae bacterium]|jgi:hypothetical protein